MRIPPETNTLMREESLVQILKAYSRFLDFLTKILRVVLVIFVAAMCLIMIYQVIMRYVFLDSKPWCEELTLYLMIATIFLGLGIASRQEAHLQVDFLLRLYSPKIRCLMEIICNLITIAVMVVLIVYSISLIGHATARSITMPLTMKQIYVIFPVSSAILILYSLELLAKNMIGFFNNGVKPELGGSDQ